MIRHRHADEFILFTQDDHARLSGRLASHVGNSSFARPEPNGDVVEAISADDGMAVVTSDAAIHAILMDWTLGDDDAKTHAKAKALLAYVRGRNDLVPIFLMGGLSGDSFFPPLAAACLTALVASLVVAMTVTPALSTLLLPTALQQPPLDSGRFDSVQARLHTEHGVEVPIVRWGEPKRRYVRFSAQAYNCTEDYRALGEAIIRLSSNGQHPH